jgi:hypothetical protein
MGSPFVQILEARVQELEAALQSQDGHLRRLETELRGYRSHLQVRSLPPAGVPPCCRSTLTRCSAYMARARFGWSPPSETTGMKQRWHCRPALPLM